MSAQSPTPAPHTRFEVLDGMRGVAAIIVMVYHFTHFAPDDPLGNATLAVDVFFALSGFVIAHSYAERLRQGMSFRDYLAKRAIRLYPMFGFGILLGSAILLILQSQGWANGTPLAVAYSFLANLSYLPSFAGLSACNMSTTQVVTGEIFPANPPAWSLLFEVVASLFFLLIFRWKARALFACALGFLAIYVACGVTLAHFDDHAFRFNASLGWGESNFLGGFPRVLFGFTMGVFLHRVWAHLSRSSSPSWTPHLSKYHGLLYVVLALFLIFPHDIKGLYPLAILLVGSPLLLLAGSFVQCTGAINLRTAQFLGWISYPLYCVHFPIGRLIFFLANRESFSPRVAMLVATILSFAVAALVCRAFDEPLRQFLTLQSKRLSGKQARPLRAPQVEGELPPAA